MDRKTMTFVLAFVLSMCAPAFSTQSTVGGIRPNAPAVNTWPASGTTLTCVAVALTTSTYTQIATAHVDRMSIRVQNVSYAVISDATLSTTRGALVFVTTAATSNLGANPTRASLETMNAWQLESCGLNSVSGTNTERGNCKLDLGIGGPIYTGALYAIAESSSTTDVKGAVEVCELRP